MFGFALSVAVGMSLSLALLVLLLTILLNMDFEQWVKVLIRCVVVAGGILFVGAQAFLVGRLFPNKWLQYVAAVGVILISVAWFFWPNWLTTDLFAIVLIIGGLSCYLQWTLNFTIVMLLGAGLFIYDIVNVYFTGNMTRLAKPMLEHGIPGMIVVPQDWAFSSPYAAGLGTGDIIFPGLMIMLAAVLSYRHNNKSPLYGGLIGYAVGMILVFGILYLAKHAQPALITLYPCVLVGILLAVWRVGLMHELFSMRHPKPAHHHVHGRDCSCDCRLA